jgi:hypothetical protein
MKPDAYVKTVLTIIMICLVIIVIRDVQLVRPAHAAVPETIKVDIVAIDGKTFAPLQVSVLGPALPVQTQ